MREFAEEQHSFRVRSFSSIAEGVFAGAVYDAVTGGVSIFDSRLLHFQVVDIVRNFFKFFA